jgi:hypothetical protein
MCGVTLNKNTKAGDDSAVHPTAIRLGTTWMTQQGWGPEEFRRLGHIISRVLKGMHVYHYHGARKPRGRAKVDVMLFEQTKREVEQLLRDTSVLKADQVHSGYPHYFRIPGKETGEPLPLIQGRTGKAEGLIAVDATEHGIVRVTGARARLFVQGAVTSGSSDPTRARGPTCSTATAACSTTSSSSATPPTTGARTGTCSSPTRAATTAWSATCATSPTATPSSTTPTSSARSTALSWSRT